MNLQEYKEKLNIPWYWNLWAKITGWFWEKKYLKKGNQWPKRKLEQAKKGN